MVEKATMDHVNRILGGVRIESTHGADIPSTVRMSVEESLMSWACILDGEPVVLWGVSSPSFFSDTAYLWSIISEDVRKAPVAIGRMSKRKLQELREQFKQLEVTVDPDYTVANRWVRWLGFTEVESVIPGTRQYRIN